MDILSPFLVVLVSMSVLMGLAWLVQYAVGNAGWVDVFWTFGTGGACVLAALWPGEGALWERQLLAAALSAIWAIRLGTFVAMRVAGGAEDARYASLRKEWGEKFQTNMLWVVIPQGPVTALISLSVVAAAHRVAPQLDLRDWLAAAILLIAIAGEGLADDQMRRFKKTAPHGSVMDKGLWGWSRHPNYFFEWMGWVAWPVMGFEPETLITWLTFVAPITMFIVLRFGTGVPVLEKVMLASRGEKFRAYQQRVSAFFPLPPQKKSPESST